MEILQRVMAAAAVLGLLAGSLWLLRRRGFAATRLARRGPRRLETLERLPLSPQHTLHLVRFGEQVLVLGCSPAGCTLLAERPRQEIEMPREVRS